MRSNVESTQQMPNILHLKPDALDTVEKCSKYTVAVVGCGRKGILFASGFADAGFQIVCTDADPSVTKKLTKGKTFFTDQEMETRLKSLITTGQLTVSSDIKKAVSKSDIVIVTVQPKSNDKKNGGAPEVNSICKQVGEALHSGALVIYSDVASYGFTESTIKETIENTSGLKTGADFGLAYAPIHDSDADNAKKLSNLELKVAAVGKDALEAAATTLNTVSKHVKQINNVKKAELATLFNVAKQNVNMALANELAVFCENLNMDYFEILQALEVSDPAFYPTLLGETNKNESYLLLESAENANTKLRLPALARQINEEMVKHAVNLTQDGLRGCGKTLRRARIAVLGAATESTAGYIKLLELKGAKVNFFNMSAKNEALDLTAKTNLNEAIEGADGITLLTRDGQLQNLNLKKIKALTKTPSVIVDLAGVFEPVKVEAEGFAYRGLGRSQTAQ